MQQIVSELNQQGWKNQPVGHYKTKINGQNVICQITGFEVFIRDRDFDEFLKNSSLSNSTKPHKMAVSGAGSTPPLGLPKASLTPYNKKIKKFLLVEFL